MNFFYEGRSGESKRQIAKGKRQKGGTLFFSYFLQLNEKTLPTFCLLIFAFCLLLSSLWRGI